MEVAWTYNWLETIGFLFVFFFGGFTDTISNLPDFTVKYFYDGQVLDFVAWRVHLTWFVLCFFICLNE